MWDSFYHNFLFINNNSFFLVNIHFANACAKGNKISQEFFAHPTVKKCPNIEWTVCSDECRRLRHFGSMGTFFKKFFFQNQTKQYVNINIIPFRNKMF
jgi:hypothetical protein